MAFNRHIFKHLEEWKQSSNRKPLVFRGARQVGKTTLVKQFAKTYKNSILLNLEFRKDAQYFDDYVDVTTLLDALFLANNISHKERSETLLFIDEIQESSIAIKQLRYFYEEIPELHVIATGSLLEQAMDRGQNFPVGRVQFLYLHPLNFEEYLEALGQTQALKALRKLPLKPTAHKVLQDHFHDYAIIGGMPEVIKTYINANHNISALSVVYESLWQSYKEDIEKYASGGADTRVIRHIINTAYLQLDKRVKFEKFGNSNYKSREVGESFRNLDMAKIIQLIYPSTSLESPIIPDLKKSPRLQFLDTGLINYELGIQAELLAMQDLSTAYKGALIPHLITQELISINSTRYTTPNFWVRDKNQSSAEVDLILTYKDKVIPIEIKSGKVGKLRSLHEFVNRCDHQYAVRMYAGKFEIQNQVTPAGKKFKLMNLPYYLGTQLPGYIDYFLSNY